MSWFLYLIECEDGSIYTGITTDVDARFAQHANGKGARYTRSRKPRAVLASFALANRSSASSAEYWVKRLTPVQKRALASGQRTLESVLPPVPVETEVEIEDETADGAMAADIVVAAAEPAMCIVATATVAIVADAPVFTAPAGTFGAALADTPPGAGAKRRAPRCPRAPVPSS